MDSGRNKALILVDAVSFHSQPRDHARTAHVSGSLQRLSFELVHSLALRRESGTGTNNGICDG